MRALQTRNGAAVIADLPDPEIKPQYVKVKNDFSSVSIGTELLMIRKNSQSSLGYSASGVAIEVGEGVTGVRPGDRVACYGTSAHRETMLSPKHLTVPIPDGVSSEDAAFGGLGAIAIHALRQAGLQFGESVAVVGAGILGQLIARVAHASNYRVVGLEPLQTRRDRLRAGGIRHVCKDKDEMTETIGKLTDGKGADAVLVCASSRKDNLIDSAIGWLRDRGRVVIVGDTGCEFDRDLLFAKEASVHISRAGGPGRYEADYEQRGFDYPVGYVRWTEGRNVQAFLRMLEENRIELNSLVTDRIAFDELPGIYPRYERSPQDMMGVVVRYGG
ncbi:zinc-dependent alcohol dehydrogenase [Cohnella algarum]|uniref:zinc-dependent alcohol dehydrogenase n=1 Tax=Cohnella algarum TaxID=2044859 RepID=UPI0019672829|nr:zinc-binding alcohol dehydrogenase [Cohnella algarum]MBN2984903.1 zinc-binding alcohol dehydrogenase [Cohnella algarum]